MLAFELMVGIKIFLKFKIITSTNHEIVVLGAFPAQYIVKNVNFFLS